MSDLVQPQPRITVERATEADIKEALMGTQGAPSYQEQFGLTSAPLGTTGYKPPSMAELELEAEKAMERVRAEAVAAQEANRTPDPFSAPTDELERFKKLYGESENEKGALRKREAELMEAFNGLMAQYDALQSRAQQPSTPQWAPQLPVAPQFGMPNPFANPYNPFGELGDDDVVQGKQVKEIIGRNILPVLDYVVGQNQQLVNRTSDLESRLIKQAKESVGLTPVDEFRLMSKNPWLKELPQAQRISALAGLRQAELQNRPAPPAPAEIPTPTEPQARILNKLTYVEGSVPNVPDTSQAALEAAKQRDYAKVMSAPSDTGERAKLFRAFAAKYGIPLGQPSDVAH